MKQAGVAGAKALFHPGENIALKIPPDEFEKTVEFYREVIGLTVLRTTEEGSVVFEFGGKRLWVDRVPALSQAEIWLELSATDTAAAAKHLARHGVVRRDEIEPLPAELNAFWIKSPSGIIHLISPSQ